MVIVPVSCLEKYPPNWSPRRLLAFSFAWIQDGPFGVLGAGLSRVDRDAQVVARRSEHSRSRVRGACVRMIDVMSVTWRRPAALVPVRSANRSLFARNALDQVLPASAEALGDLRTGWGKDGG